ncbi:MAG: hypothetical protein ACRERD_31830, partial [Candidatus Binatia bacterium]
MLSSRAARLGARPLLDPLDERESLPSSARAPLPRDRSPEPSHELEDSLPPSDHVSLPRNHPPEPSYELEDSSSTEMPFFIGEADEEQDTLPWERFESGPEVTFSPRSILLLLGLLLLGYAALGFYFLSHPVETAAMLARLPLLGIEPVNEPASAQQVTLTDLKG